MGPCSHGTKGRPVVLQREMSQMVLGGLIGYGVELYLDDCIVYGQTEEEFKLNLKAVFERFRAHNITLNPEKCRFGLSSIKYLGHIIDQNGIHFSREKIEKVRSYNLRLRL